MADVQDIKMDIIIQDVTPHIQAILPTAQLSSIVFSGNCNDLPKLYGEIVFDFVGTKRSFPQKRVVSILATINTTAQTLNVHARDMTDYYWTTETLDLEDKTVLTFDEIFNIAFEEITALGLSDCDVTITRLKDSWVVRCGPLENFIQECRFGIDARSGKIIPVSLE